MDKAKAVNCPLVNYFKLSTIQSPSTNKEKKEMEKITYASVAKSLICHGVHTVRYHSRSWNCE